VAGVFITLEGVEGSGKSTQMKFLADYLRGRGYRVLITREPGGTQIGDKIRDILLNPEFKEMDYRTEVLLYAAGRAQHVSQVIKPALKLKKIVICDRYIDSSLVYQGFGRGLTLEDILNINKWATQDLEPDLTILLYIPVEEGLRRATEVYADRIEREGIEFHRKVHEGYRELARKFPKRYYVVEALGDPKEIHREIVKRVETLLKTKKRIGLKWYLLLTRWLTPRSG